MDRIPIVFTHQNRTYTGHFGHALGAGSSYHFHLMIDNFYYGQLFYTDNWGWQFFSNSHPELKELENYFGSYVTAWADGV